MAGYLTGVRGWNTEQIGIIIAAQKIGSVLTQALVGWFIDRTTLGTLSRPDVTYIIGQVPAGTHLVRTRLIGFRPQSATVTAIAVPRSMLR